MGPSGCGKTTFLDLLNGRRKYESTKLYKDVRERADGILKFNYRVHMHCFASIIIIMSIQEGIFINGIPMNDIGEWYTANTGYVLQLATPYYEELTVRENLTLAAEMKLPSSMEQKERFERVEQVMQVVRVVIIILGPCHA